MAEADANLGHDVARKELAGVRNKARGLMYTTERSISELGSYLTEDELNLVRRDLDRLRKVLELDEPETIQAALEALERSSYRIAEVMYRDAG